MTYIKFVSLCIERDNCRGL